MRRAAFLLVLLLGTAPAMTVREGRLTVTLSEPRDRAYLGTVFEAWRGAERDLRALGLSVPRVELRAAGSADDFAHQTGEAWFVAAVTRGQTIHTQRLGALAARGTLPLTLRHEAFHAAQPAGLPRWLAEGLARLFSGEAGSDPPGATGLEGVPDAALNQRLAARTADDLLRIYREATRRARERVRAQGWAGVLGAKSPPGR